MNMRDVRNYESEFELSADMVFAKGIAIELMRKIRRYAAQPWSGVVSADFHQLLRDMWAQEQALRRELQLEAASDSSVESSSPEVNLFHGVTVDHSSNTGMNQGTEPMLDDSIPELQPVSPTDSVASDSSLPALVSPVPSAHHPPRGTSCFICANSVGTPAPHLCERLRETAAPSLASAVRARPEVILVVRGLLARQRALATIVRLIGREYGIMVPTLRGGPSPR